LSAVTIDIPPYNDFLWPAMAAVDNHGGSASIDEMLQTVVALEGLTDEQQAVLHKDGPRTEVGYRLAWARTYLKGMGLLTNSQRGVWTLTEEGYRFVSGLRASDSAAREEIRERWSTYAVKLRAEQRARRLTRDADGEPLVDDDEDEQDTAPRTWKEELLDSLMSLSPPAFERLAQRLLREAGFLSATVTGRSGDGGIDGVGVYRMSLLSFPVFFQCKRYKGSVSPSAVRDFRGAMAGRGDKGLLMTTGTFTADAKAEATRDGAPPIDLIDGDRLCDLLKEYGIGLHVTVRQIEEVKIDPDFFETV
jgi:restriction system protein